MAAARPAMEEEGGTAHRQARAAAGTPLKRGGPACEASPLAGVRRRGGRDDARGRVACAARGTAGLGPGQIGGRHGAG
eukprot:15452767-Alexandrium_andersonii.AAC.1